MPLPAFVSKAEVAARLIRIFPEGTPHRGYCTRDLAASTVFVMLYIGAVEGTGRFLAPKHVYAMSDEQASRRDDAARLDYQTSVAGRRYHGPGQRWYADNTREPIRDETLREGLMPIGAVVSRSDLPTTSSKPRYALRADFATLFDPALTGDDLEVAIGEWQASSLSPGALARIAIMRRGAAGGGSNVVIRFPNGESRLMSPGPSSFIAQAVIEVFAPRFLARPAVLWVSESGNKVVARDETLATDIGLSIETDKNLPDIILVDLEPLLIVFVEVVATDGAVTARRREALHAITDAAGFARTQVAFVTAYEDRQKAGFKKTVGNLAWGSFAWFASEPEGLMRMQGDLPASFRLSDSIRR